MVTDMKALLISSVKCHALAFDRYMQNWPWLIVKVKVKVMHISKANILDMLNDKTSSINVNKYEFKHGLFIGIYAFDPYTF